jgi:hypothetical protein
VPPPPGGAQRLDPLDDILAYQGAGAWGVVRGLHDAGEQVQEGRPLDLDERQDPGGWARLLSAPLGVSVEPGRIYEAALRMRRLLARRTAAP